MLLIFLKRFLPFRALFLRMLFSNNKRKKKMDKRVPEVDKSWTVLVPRGNSELCPAKVPELEAARCLLALPNTFLNCFDKCSFVLNMYGNS